MTNAPTFTEKSKKQRDNIKTATKNFDYTTITDRLKTASWSYSSYPTGVIKPVYEFSISIQDELFPRLATLAFNCIQMLSFVFSY